MNDKEFVEGIRDRPSLFGLNGCYYPTAMFLEGFDMASSGGLLRGFTEWLVVRGGECSSLHWHVLVLQRALPEFEFRGWKHLGPLHPDQDREATESLLSLVLEFLDVRDDPRQLAQMYTQYEALYARTIG
ncbi:hypothetical protein [Streptomyces sp. NPDC088794]|uniref:hypothetical protein n=1 Tax=Streptomyces sp. NPDC088794 TaxID=3365902 RepID=UPI003811A5A9